MRDTQNINVSGSTYEDESNGTGHVAVPVSSSSKSSTSPSRTPSTGAAVHQSTSSSLQDHLDQPPTVRQCDPAMPTTVSLNEEIGIGPIVMNSDTHRHGHGFRKKWALNRHG